jgi:hypothetical protein
MNKILNIDEINISQNSKKLLGEISGLIDTIKKDKREYKVILLCFMKNYCADFKDRMFNKSLEFHKNNLIKKKYSKSTVNSYVSDTFRKKETSIAQNLDQILEIVVNDFIKDYIEHHQKFSQNFHSLMPIINAIENTVSESNFVDTQIAVLNLPPKFTRQKSNQTAE